MLNIKHTFERYDYRDTSIFTGPICSLQFADKKKKNNLFNIFISFTFSTWKFCCIFLHVLMLLSPSSFSTYNSDQRFFEEENCFRIQGQVWRRPSLIRTKACLIKILLVCVSFTLSPKISFTLFVSFIFVIVFCLFYCLSFFLF